MNDEKIENMISLLKEIKQTMKNYICSYCRNKGKFYECDYCYTCDKFDAKGADDE